jgi:general secretion pathway protein A
MFLAHWGLARSPFADGQAAPLFYEADSQAEALARLRFVVGDGRRLSVVAGDRGVGKTFALHRFAEECRREGRPVASASLAGLTVRELWWQLAAQLAIGPQPSDDAVALFRRLAGFVDSLRWRATSAAILLDDADLAGPDVRAQLARLVALGGHQPRLSLVLATSPAAVERLGADLLDAADLRIYLEPWSETECIGYLQHALLEAGCDRPAFDDEALAALAALSGGVPRRVNRLADQALLAAAAEGLETVNAAMVEASAAAINYPTPTAQAL